MELMVTQILTNLVQLGILVGLTSIINFVFHKAGKEKVGKFYDFAKIAVQSAEQIFGSGLGADKKKYAVDFLMSLKVPQNLAETLIESAVKELTLVLNDTGLEKTNIDTTTNTNIQEPEKVADKPQA